MFCRRRAPANTTEVLDVEGRGSKHASTNMVPDAVCGSMPLAPPSLNRPPVYQQVPTTTPHLASLQRQKGQDSTPSAPLAAPLAPFQPLASTTPSATQPPPCTAAVAAPFAPFQ